MTEPKMYVLWDDEAGDIVGAPRNAPGLEGNWVRCEMPPRRRSQGQELEWAMEDHPDGGHILVGSWVGSDDPGDAPVDASEIRAAWLELSEGPVQASDGNWYQFDDTSERLMKGALRALFLTGETVDWRLVDNSEVTLNYDDLRDIFEDLQDQQALRGVALNAEYLQFKAEGATFKQLANWRASYSAGS